MLAQLSVIEIHLLNQMQSKQRTNRHLLGFHLNQKPLTPSDLQYSQLTAESASTGVRDKSSRSEVLP